MRLIALRRLYKDGQVEYEPGSEVPVEAYPDYQVETLLKTGGLRRVEVEEIPEEVASMYESPHGYVDPKPQGRWRKRKGKAE